MLETDIIVSAIVINLFSDFEQLIKSQSSTAETAKSALQNLLSTGTKSQSSTSHYSGKMIEADEIEELTGKVAQIEQALKEEKEANKETAGSAVFSPPDGVILW